MAKFIITEEQLLNLRATLLNEEDRYGDLRPGTWRDCQGVGDIEKCVATSGTPKYKIQDNKFPYHSLIYKATDGDSIGLILKKIGEEGYEVAQPMKFNTLMRDEKDLKVNDVLLFDFGA